jgi:hypothetical protein
MNELYINIIVFLGIIGIVSSMLSMPIIHKNIIVIFLNKIPGKVFEKDIINKASKIGLLGFVAFAILWFYIEYALFRRHPLSTHSALVQDGYITPYTISLYLIQSMILFEIISVMAIRFFLRISLFKSIYIGSIAVIGSLVIPLLFVLFFVNIVLGYAVQNDGDVNILIDFFEFVINDLSNSK